ncbi:hypothetical protein HAX54_028399 [Datura stramonium]|uniref:Uncharacterized protein n=1 Tax=Datura stramonium TaxID=4076 RepID=A0ABS8V5B9_DATST|nr:hypothetical protein [Datura stramonium]
MAEKTQDLESFFGEVASYLLVMTEKTLDLEPFSGEVMEKRKEKAKEKKEERNNKQAMILMLQYKFHQRRTEKNGEEIVGSGHWVLGKRLCPVKKKICGIHLIQMSDHVAFNLPWWKVVKNKGIFIYFVNGGSIIDPIV